MTEKRYKDQTLTPQQRAADLLTHMTNEEKAAQLGAYYSYQFTQDENLPKDEAAKYLKNGIGQISRVSSNAMPARQCAQLSNNIQKYLVEETRLGIPAIVHEEACSGFSAMGATIFPQTIGVACSFMPGLAHTVGETGGRQMRTVGAHQALAPLLDITRDPRWGRTEETYGEDPCLVSAMGCAFIKGMQGKDLRGGVLATGKHFVGYGASEGGMNWAPAHIPERELHEVYLTPFEAAVKHAGLASVMNGYHELDGVPCAASRELLTGTLKEKWGFEGTVVSDYFAVNQLKDYHQLVDNKVAAAQMALDAGLDVELPNVDCFGMPLLEGLTDGRVDIALVDAAVYKVLVHKFSLGLFEKPYVNKDAADSMMDTAADRIAACEMAKKTMVLLKNDNNTLPLSEKPGRVAVIGPCADDARTLLGDYTFPGQYEGLIGLYNSGSNDMNQPIPLKINLNPEMVLVKSYREVLVQRLGENHVIYAKGCAVRGEDESVIAEAVNAAKCADVVLLFLGDLAGVSGHCTVGESVDRSSLELPGVQAKLLREVCATGTPVVLVLNNGRPYAMEWAEQHVSAILEAWLPGEEGAEAVVDTLFGKNNPGGKLAITFPRNVGQVPSFYMHKKSGGRTHWRGDYDDSPASPRYPFGYGLSYTRFAFSDFRLENAEVAIGGKIIVDCIVQNTGEVAGDEVVQLYIRDEVASVTRPVKELKGFVRVSLQAGEKKQVRFEVSTAQLGFYSVDMRYIVEPGEIQLMLGASSTDIRLDGRVRLTGDAREMEQRKTFVAKAVIKEL